MTKRSGQCFWQPVPRQCGLVPFSVAQHRNRNMTEYTTWKLFMWHQKKQNAQKKTELLEETEFSEKAELSEEERQEYVSGMLWKHFQDQMLPDKTARWSLVEGMGEMEENSLRFQDVDSDGVPELVLLAHSTYGRYARAFTSMIPRPKELKEELLGFPSAEYYEGGLL